MDLLVDHDNEVRPRGAIGYITLEDKRGIRDWQTGVPSSCGKRPDAPSLKIDSSP